jgi:type III restriction enzyme
MFSVDEIAEQMHNRFKSIDMETADAENPTNYADKYNLDWLKKIISNSLDRIGEKTNKISDDNRQRIYQAFGVVHRSAAKAVRYRISPKALFEKSTNERNRNSVGYASIKRGESSIFYDDLTLKLSDEDSMNFLKELESDDSRPVSALEKIDNTFIFKTPLNLVISDHKPERLFIKRLIAAENAKTVDAWLKSTDQDFYTIEYSWKKGEHPKRGLFNPDFFIKIEGTILVVEIKGDEEIRDPSDENKAKFKAAKKHFRTLNDQQNRLKYYFNFLTPEDYDYFFNHLRNGNFHFSSKFDAELEKNGS